MVHAIPAQAQRLAVFAVDHVHVERVSLQSTLITVGVRVLTIRFDGSMMNGLQTLATWSDYFGRPEGGQLGLLNAIQVCHLKLSQW
jgi:hypothetical protein